MTRCKTILSILTLTALMAAVAIQPVMAKEARHVGPKQFNKQETTRVKTDELTRPADSYEEAHVNPNSSPVPLREGLAVGDNCADPIKIFLPAALPYADLGQTTCGRLNDYQGVSTVYCLNSSSSSADYTTGEDIIYELTVTAATTVSFSVDFKTTTWGAFSVDNSCPNDGSCLGRVSSSSSGVKTIGPLSLAVGTYYVMIDTWSTPVCIPNFDFKITTPPDPTTCATPIVASISAGTLPLVMDNLFTCGRVNNYSATCLDSYDGGEDMVLQLNVTGPLFVDLTMDPKGTTYTAMAIDNVCPLDGTPAANCLGLVASSTGTVKSITGLTLATGTYYVMFDTWPTPNCIPNFKLTITGGTPPPANNACASATPIGDVTNLAFNTSAASRDGAGTCIGATSPNIWYCFTAPSTGNTTFSLCGSSFDTKMAIYAGCSCAPLGTQLACQDDDCGSASEVTLPVIGGQQYTIEVGGYSSASGAGILNVHTVAPPPNDDCASVIPTVLTPGVPVTFTGNNTGASADCASFPGNNAWEAFTLTSCQNVTLDYCGTSPAFTNAWLNLAMGCPCASFTPGGDFDVVTCPDGNVTITWSALPAGTYYYPVLTEAGAVGPYTINVVSSTVSSYCAADGFCDEYIANVQLGTISHPSSCGASYEDYTAFSTDLTQYVGYTLTVTNGTPYTSDYCGAWVDWDHDNCFSASEAVTMSAGPSVFTGTVTAPGSALMGPTRMRIRIVYDEALSSCGTSEYGEVEDYTVNVVPLVPTALIAPNPQYLYYKFAVVPVINQFHVGNLAGARPVTDINLATFKINGLTPSSVSVIPSYAGFFGSVVEATMPLTTFLNPYGLLYDVNNLTFTASWDFTDTTPGSITDDVTIIGKSSPIPSRYIIPDGNFVTLPGDFNIDGQLSVSDAVSMVSYIFAGGSAPSNALIGDANCSGSISISDVVYMIRFIFSGGAAPCATSN